MSNWTKRGVMLKGIDDLNVQAIVADKSYASRILITGESSIHFLDEKGVRLLIGMNKPMVKAGIEPLFIETKEDTVRMTRFDLEFIRKNMDRSKFNMLVADEARRLKLKLGTGASAMTDFYDEMVKSIPVNHVPIVMKDGKLDDYYSAVYLSCLILFGKQGYLGVPVAQYFAQPDVATWMHTMDLIPLSEAELNEARRVRNDKIRMLTNEEINFIVGLYDRRGR